LTRTLNDISTSLPPANSPDISGIDRDRLGLVQLLNARSHSFLFDKLGEPVSYHSALEHYRAAVDIFSNLDDFDRVVDVKLSLVSLLRKGDYSKKREALDLLLELKTEINTSSADVRHEYWSEYLHLLCDNPDFITSDEQWGAVTEQLNDTIPSDITDAPRSIKSKWASTSSLIAYSLAVRAYRMGDIELARASVLMYDTVGKVYQSMSQEDAFADTLMHRNFPLLYIYRQTHNPQILYRQIFVPVFKISNYKTWSGFTAAIQNSSRAAQYFFEIKDWLTAHNILVSCINAVRSPDAEWSWSHATENAIGLLNTIYPRAVYSALKVGELDAAIIMQELSHSTRIRRDRFFGPLVALIEDGKGFINSGEEVRAIRQELGISKEQNKDYKSPEKIDLDDTWDRLFFTMKGEEAIAGLHLRNAYFFDAPEMSYRELSSKVPRDTLVVTLIITDIGSAAVTVASGRSKAALDDVLWLDMATRERIENAMIGDGTFLRGLVDTFGGSDRTNEGGFRFHRHPAAPKDWTDWSEDYETWNRAIDSTCERLGGILIDPLLSNTVRIINENPNVKEVALVVTGILQQIPIEAFLSRKCSGHDIIWKRVASISALGSASEIREHWQGRKDIGQFIGFFPDTATNVSGQVEADLIQSTTRSDRSVMLTGHLATRSAFVIALQNQHSKIIHLSGHGSQHMTRPHQSYLQLAGGKKLSAGVLGAAVRPSEGGVRLVFLSACSTAVGVAVQPAEGGRRLLTL
jgi:CHAT domain